MARKRNSRNKRTSAKKRGEPRAKRSKIRHKEKKKKIAIVTRKEQPMPKSGIMATARSEKGMPIFMQVMEVTALEKADISLQRVSSSWIKEIGYHRKDKIGVMTTLPMKRKNGTTYASRGYNILRFPWSRFEQFYYAHSKGTFFNYFIKGKYKIERYR